MSSLLRRYYEVKWHYQLAVALIAASAIVFYYGQQSNHETVFLLKQVNQTQAQLESLKLSRQTSSPREAEHIKGKDLPTYLQELFRLADQHQVELSKGKYRIDNTGELHTLKYEATFHTISHYPKVQGFLIAVLKSSSILLEDISFDRDDVNESQVKTEFSLAIYFENW